MRILGIDTSTMRTSVGIVEDDEIIAQYMLSGSRFQSEALIEMIDEIFRKLDFSINDIDLLAVGVGPGSFTGVRIAVTVQRTFAQFLNKDICAVSSLMAMALNTNSDRIIIPIVDAKRHRAYSGIYKEICGRLETLRDDDLKDVGEIIKEASKYGDKILLTGPSRYSFAEEFKNANFDVKITSDMGLTGTKIAKLAHEKYIKCGADNLFKVLPNYINASQAQRDFKVQND